MLEDLLLIAAGGVAVVTGTLLWKSRDTVAVAPEQPEQDTPTRAAPYLPPEIYSPAVEQPVDVFHKPHPVARQEAVLIKKSTLVDIYQTPLFAANVDEMAAIQKEMSEALAVAGIPEPTTSQWKMILSSSRVDKVLAGAGAGKSSASSLRVVFLHRTLGVPLDQITVVTFTRASRADMVSKIIRDMSAFGITLTEPEARRVVRTFHSMILSLVEGHSAPVAYFEQIGGESGSHSEADDLGTLNPKQLDYLRDIFAKTFRENKAFSSGIGQILLEKLSIRQSRYADSESLDKAIAVAGPRDHIITRAVADAWQEVIGLDERDGTVSWKPVALKTSKASGSWFANGKVVSTNMPIVLGCGAIGEFTDKPLNRTKYSISDFDKDRTLGALGNVRLKIVATIATGKYLYIETARDLADLYALVEWVNSGHNSDNTTFPAFSLRIPGDTRSSSIFEALYSLGSFIASTGLDVRTAALAIAKKMSKSPEFVLEMNVCLALAEFWPAMHTHGQSTYDELFLAYGSVERVGELKTKRLNSMSYLVIDEFQDISALIINWIKAVHTVLVQQGAEPSLLCVGDISQSIYGWRGSDPEFIATTKNTPIQATHW